MHIVKKNKAYYQSKVHFQSSRHSDSQHPQTNTDIWPLRNLSAFDETVHLYLLMKAIY